MKQTVSRIYVPHTDTAHKAVRKKRDKLCYLTHTKHTQSNKKEMKQTNNKFKENKHQRCLETPACWYSHLWGFLTCSKHIKG